jgi:hypothetical protein
VPSGVPGAQAPSPGLRIAAASSFFGMSVAVVMTNILPSLEDCGLLARDALQFSKQLPTFQNNCCHQLQGLKTKAGDASKRLCLSTKLQGVTSQKAVTLILIGLMHSFRLRQFSKHIFYLH